ncbi:MAG: hypothetical protein OXI96_06205 [Acidimicrobiaceae bacterium]|nr:hypothetical protein [Acidimicrobiaceae bacterium]
MSYFSRLYGNNGYGNISWIGHIGGAPGTRRYTYHNVGRALDVTWIQWTGGNASNPQVAESEVFDSNGHWRPTTHRRLVAVEAGLRKWFGYVLNRYIGCILPPTECNGEPLEGPRSSHHNHFHVDNGCPVALRVDRESRIRLDRTIRSCHYFIQDCINAFTDVDVDYDGTWDAQTDRAYEHLLSDLGMECLNPIKFINHYMLFLDYIMMHGFADKPAGTFRWGDKAIL